MNSTPDPAEAPTSPAPAAEEVGESVERTLDAPVADPDPALLEAHALALSALAEITPAATVGDAAGYRVEPDGVVSLRFENRLSGYPGWFWTVSLARVEGAEPTVLEVELLPGDDALLAPDWVPWAVRLADYQAAQVALAEAADGAEDEDADELDDVDDLDAADFDDDGSPILHAGDLDGVDIDELDEDADDDDTDDLDDEDSDEDEDADDSDDEDDDSDDEDEDSDDDEDD